MNTKLELKFNTMSNNLINNYFTVLPSKLSLLSNSISKCVGIKPGEILPNTQ